MPVSTHDPDRVTVATAAASDQASAGLHASRRAVLSGAASLGAVAAIVAIGSGTSLPGQPGEAAEVTGDSAAADATIVAHIRAGSSDVVTLHSGNREVVITDRALVQALINGIR